MNYINPENFKFTEEQVESLIKQLVPVVAEPKDYEFFSGVIRLRAQASTSSADFAYFIAKLIRACEQ